MICYNFPPKKPISSLKKDNFSIYSVNGVTHAMFATDFAECGYIGICVNDLCRWQEIHKWCRETIGEDNYTWTGEVFWFDDKDNAIEFSLKWG